MMSLKQKRDQILSQHLISGRLGEVGLKLDSKSNSVG